MKEMIERIYRNCFLPAHLTNIEAQNRWEEAYRAVGKALKDLLDKEKLSSKEEYDQSGSGIWRKK